MPRGRRVGIDIKKGKGVRGIGHLIKNPKRNGVTIKNIKGMRSVKNLILNEKSSS